MVRTELSFRLPNSPGALARIATLLSAEQVRLLAFTVEPSGTTRVVVDKPERASAALTREHVQVERRDVIVTVVPGRSVGPLLASTASAGVNLDYAYASSLDGDHALTLVLGVDDALRASAAAGV